MASCECCIEILKKKKKKGGRRRIKGSSMGGRNCITKKERIGSTNCTFDFILVFFLSFFLSSFILPFILITSDEL